MTVRAESPTHRISVTPDSRLDESATAVIVLQRGSLLSPNIASIGFSKQFFSFQELIDLMERISIELNLKGC